jgi:hypothetical protein
VNWNAHENAEGISVPERILEKLLVLLSETTMNEAERGTMYASTGDAAQHRDSSIGNIRMWASSDQANIFFQYSISAE